MTAKRESSRLRVLIYVQHLMGVGHYVRMSEIAKALAQRHDVMLTDGGWPVPRAGLEQVAMLPLPRISRRDLELVSLQDGLGIAAVMQARSQCLRDTIKAFRPDVVVVEHYPFSKWILGDEVAAMAEASRAANPTVKIISSMRDIQQRKTRFEARSEETYAREVTDSLRRHFEAILIHGDPALIRLEAQLPFLSAAGLRLAYTGIVSEKPVAMKPVGTEATTPYALASVGGGRDDANLLFHTLDAWKWLRQRGELRGWKLVLCPGLDETDEILAEQTRRYGEDVVLRPFGRGFLDLLQGAALSVSCAGYNTCANILQTRCRAVLVPNADRPDQSVRAPLFAARQLAVVVPPAELNRATLVAAILKSLAAPLPNHDFALDGAERTRDLIEEIAASERPALSAGFRPRPSIDNPADV